MERYPLRIIVALALIFYGIPTPDVAASMSWLLTPMMTHVYALLRSAAYIAVAGWVVVKGVP